MKIEVETEIADPVCEKCGDELDCSQSDWGVIKVDVCYSCLEKAREEASSEGYDNGLEEGRQEGYDKGYEEGKRDTYNEAYDEGYQAGLRDSKPYVYGSTQ